MNRLDYFDASILLAATILFLVLGMPIAQVGWLIVGMILIMLFYINIFEF